MRKIDYSKIDWGYFQKIHNEGVYWSHLPKLIGIDRDSLKKAEEHNFIKKIIHKDRCSKINWDYYQKIHNKGVYWSNLPKLIGIDLKTLKRAEKLGFIIKVLHKRTVTEAHKKHLSEMMKTKYQNGQMKGWFHINTSTDRRSYPERFFFEVLQKNNFFEKYTIKEKFSFGKYFLDFAILELKLDVEVDGQQHYATKEAIEHDNIRNKYLNEQGWKVYRICWRQMNKNPTEEINNFLTFINTIETQTNRFYDVSDMLKESKKQLTQQEYKQSLKNAYYKTYQLCIETDVDLFTFNWAKQLSNITQISNQRIIRAFKVINPDLFNVIKKQPSVSKRKNKIGTQKEYFEFYNKEYKIQQQKYIIQVETSNIDFSKFGWVTKTSTIINQKPGKVKKWMLKIMPEFYNEKCFKRKPSS